MITRDDEICHWLSLNAIPRLGIKRLLKTAKQFNTNLSALNQLSQMQLQSVGWNSEQIACLHEASPFNISSIEWLNSSQSHNIISYECDEYPNQLKEISQAPLLLFSDGDYTLLSRAQLAVVGTRSPTHSGLENTKRLLNDLLLRTPLVITSGLALGIDGHSHQIALSMGAKTIAVLGNGIDIVYPKRHAALYSEIKDQGLLVSEFPPTVKPNAKFFPRRNRIISGLSLGTLVTEARIKSGTLITARYALEQGREVFAMPSNINNPLAQGCHWLIKQGAKLCECAQDIIDELAILITECSEKQKTGKKEKQGLASPINLDSVHTRAKLTGLVNDEQNNDIEGSSLILNAVDFELTSIDVIATRTGQSVSALLIRLIEYEMRGLVSSTSEGYIKLRG